MAGRGQQIEINLEENKKIYFASDQHLGAPDSKNSLEREKIFVRWLDEIKHDCQVLFLLGDLFDFWHEYKYVIPKGFVRTLGKLAELSDSGIKIYFFVGNHDMWMNDYFEEELNIKIFRDRQEFKINGKSFFIAHGDGLGPGDKRYKLMKKLFSSKIAQFLFYVLHPDFAVWFGNYMSRKNKMISKEEDFKFTKEEDEWLVQYVERKLENSHYDYFIFGHRHLPLNISVKNSLYINLGDWVEHYTYAIYDGNNLTLESYSAQ